mmetsp:Transcript_73471/g.204106  ORF Transcript_73471/g.204106 Transcript_73471/m.204106 type:complete len:422 (-) Transcript_73471:65-1330(-)
MAFDDMPAPKVGEVASEEGDFQNFEVLQKDPGQPAVLVLGGTNFMGRALVEDLVSREARVCVVNRGRLHWGTADPTAGKTARVVADRRHVDTFAKRLREATRRLGGVWDLVADFSAFDAPDMRASLNGLGAKFKVYVYISSDSVYEVCAWASDKWKPRSSSAGQACVTENLSIRPPDKAKQDVLNEADSYGHEKLEAEEVLVERVPPGCRCLSLRLPDVIGPYDSTLRLWAYWHWLRAAEEGAPPPQVPSFKRKKRSHSDSAPPNEAPLDQPLAVVYSRDVSRFILTVLDGRLPQEPPPIDAVNLSCEEQVPLGAVLGLLAEASGLPKKRPRFAVTKNPKTFLPSVDRPWPLNLQRMSDVYGFKPTPLADVLKNCALFFEEGCARFPRDARRAAKKLPADPADIALWVASLEKITDASDSS